MTNRSNYPEQVESAGGQPAGDDDPLAELARIVGNNVGAYRAGSRVEDHASERPRFPVLEGQQGKSDVPAPAPQAEPDAFAALDAVFASGGAGSHDPFADLSEAALSVKGQTEPVDFISDLPPVPKAQAPQPAPRPVAEPAVVAPVERAPVPQPAPVVRNVAPAPRPATPRPAPQPAAQVVDPMHDDLSRDLEASLVASLDQAQVEREPAPRPVQPVSRAHPVGETSSPVMSRATSSLRERLGRTTPAPMRSEPAAPVSREPVTREPAAPVHREFVAPAAPVSTADESRALNEFTENDYDSWRAERAAKQAAAQQANAVAASAVAATAAASVAPRSQPVHEPVLRGSHDDTPQSAPAFEPDLTALAAETGAHQPAAEPDAAAISPKHLEDALMAEFSLDGPAEDAAPDFSADDVDHAYKQPSEADTAFDRGVDDIFADAIAQEPEPEVVQPEPARPLDPKLAAELNEIEAMSAGFEKVAEEIDPFAGEEDEAWQLDEAVANDSSLDDMSWPAAAEKLAQTEAAHQAAMQAKRPDADHGTPPPGGYDLDAVAQAMRREDPSLDGGVLPQAVPRPTAPLPHEAETSSSGGMRKGLMAAASLAAIVVAGGAGLMLFDFGGSTADSTPPPLIRADVSPMKEVPAPSEQPSNEQAKIFSPQDAANAPSEERLLPRDDTQVEPLPPAPETADTTNSNGVFEVNRPKRVRTVVVRPDGSIVQNGANAQPTANVATAAPRAVSTTQVRVPSQPAATAGQWDPLPGEQQSAVQQQASNGFGTAPTQPAFADPFAQAQQPTAANTAVSLAGVTAVPASKPFVSGSVPAQTAVRVVNVAQQQPAAAVRQPSAPLDLTGGRAAPVATPTNTQVAAVAPQAVAPTPTPSEGVVGNIPPGTYIVQVASVRTIDDARGQIRSYNRRYPNLMALVTPVITRADLGDKGIYYRIQVPFDGSTSANTFCTEFKTAGGDCYVRRN